MRCDFLSIDDDNHLAVVFGNIGDAFAIRAEYGMTFQYAVIFLSLCAVGDDHPLFSKHSKVGKTLAIWTEQWVTDKVVFFVLLPVDDHRHFAVCLCHVCYAVRVWTEKSLADSGPGVRTLLVSIHHHVPVHAGPARVPHTLAVRTEDDSVSNTVVSFAFLSVYDHKLLTCLVDCIRHVFSIRAEEDSALPNAFVLALFSSVHNNELPSISLCHIAKALTVLTKKGIADTVVLFPLAAIHDDKLVAAEFRDEGQCPAVWAEDRGICAIPS